MKRKSYETETGTSYGDWKMKKSIGMVAALVCLTCSAMAESRIGPFVSWIKSNDANAFGGGLKYEWMFSEKVGVNARVAYLSSDGDSVVPLLLGIMGVLPLEGCSLYAGVGGGYFIPNSSDGETPDAAFGFYVDAGVRCPISDKVDLFAEVGYVQAKGDDTETTTHGSGRTSRGYYTYTSTVTTGGLDISGPVVNLGIALRF
jgi:hypothetical protein